MNADKIERFLSQLDGANDSGASIQIPKEEIRQMLAHLVAEKEKVKELEAKIAECIVAKAVTGIPENGMGIMMSEEAYQKEQDKIHNLESIAGRVRDVEGMINFFRNFTFIDGELGYDYNFVDDLDDLLMDKKGNKYGGKELAQAITDYLQGKTK